MTIQERVKNSVVVCPAGTLRHHMFQAKVKVAVVPCIRPFRTANRVLLVGQIWHKKWKTSKCRTILIWLIKFRTVWDTPQNPNFQIDRPRSHLISTVRTLTRIIMVEVFQLDLLRCPTSLLHHLSPLSIIRSVINSEKMISPKWSTTANHNLHQTKTFQASVKKLCINCLKIQGLLLFPQRSISKANTFSVWPSITHNTVHEPLCKEWLTVQVCP